MVAWQFATEDWCLLSVPFARSLKLLLWPACRDLSDIAEGSTWAEARSRLGQGGCLMGAKVPDLLAAAPARSPGVLGLHLFFSPEKKGGFDSGVEVLCRPQGSMRLYGSWMLWEGFDFQGDFWRVLTAPQKPSVFLTSETTIN